MFLLCASAALAQCLLLLLLAGAGRNLRLKAAEDAQIIPENWPKATLIIPVAGSHPGMSRALQSLLRQDYPNFTPLLITATAEEKAAALVARLQKQFPAARHLVAGQAGSCGQKNHNSLCGVRAADETTEVLVFCDSTHPAEPGFIRTLISPIARGEADFSTGYHQVIPGDQSPVTLAYALCVLLMRLLQALAPFTQPWGGAMAVRRSTFERCNIAEIWADNVVDDCSLAGALPALGVKVRLCPGALLNTEAAAHPLPIWRAWMERQVLFLKFCVPTQWILLGVFCLIMTLPLCWTAAGLCLALYSAAPGTALWPLLYCALAAAILNMWRKLLPAPVPLLPWLKAFICASAMFAWVYARGITAKGIVWHGISYAVGRGGRVIAVHRKGEQANDSM
jgi:cellulose synthase/poly-beta-1,6-N-acetylglucosamine synthase-like glycosyltransferase